MSFSGFSIHVEAFYNVIMVLLHASCLVFILEVHHASAGPSKNLLEQATLSSSKVLVKAELTDCAQAVSIITPGQFDNVLRLEWLALRLGNAVSC